MSKYKLNKYKNSMHLTPGDDVSFGADATGVKKHFDDGIKILASANYNNVQG